MNDPILSVFDSRIKKQVEEITDCLKLSNDKIHKVHQIFLSEIENGLSEDEQIRKTSSLLMINTFVPSFDCIRTEQLDGDYLSLDLGSTNFRVLHNHLNSKGQDSFRVHYYDIPDELRQNNSVVNVIFFLNDFHFLIY